MKRRCLVLLSTLPVLIFSCRKDNNSSGLFAPALITAEVTDITDTSATAGGSFVTADVLALQAVGFQYGTDSTFNTNYTNVTETAHGAAPFTISLTHLISGAIYYVRAFTYTGLGHFFYGNTVSFSTIYQPGNYNVSTLAGTGIAGFQNAPDLMATFSSPEGAAVDNTGNIYIADNTNKAIRLIAPNGAVSTFAITNSPPNDVVTDNQGNVYVAEGYVILKITPNGQISTFAGSGTAGSADGTGTAASFNSPLTLSIDPSGNLYVGDYTAFRRITPAGVVTTLTNYFGTTGPYFAIAVDNHFNIYETNTQIVIKIDSLGNLTSFSASLGGINELRSDTAGNIYATNEATNKVDMITPAGVVTTLAGSGAIGARDGNSAIASFNGPIGLTPDNAGNIIVCDFGNNLIRKISPL